ncbi:MAG: sigma-54-dependent Fis family transcriptional regulator [Deltaproteobacteria bacterium]|nr:sigma-54-dependent Fis family transcriptional regulator [Deltaproteobacteria bacterium]
MPAMEPAQILIVDDEPNMLKVLGALLKREGYHIIEAMNGEDALELLEEHHVDAMVTDMKMPGMDGMQVLDTALDRHADLPVIMITAHGTIDTAVEALKKGAFDYVTKPFEWSELRSVIAKAVQTVKLGSREVGVESIVMGHEGSAVKDISLIGSSEPMQQVFDVLEKVADTPSTVLITGESGTGKDLIAKEMHARSRWSEKPFIKVNCAAIPSELLESELFGYDKGAFTGAVSTKPGRFELAHGGTLFLDEIGEMSPEMQVKLLRAVQDKEFERVGGLKTYKVETRLITATNIDIKKAVSDGRFREDLYYRLNIVNIELPPLRERRSDIPPLCAHFLGRFNEKLEKNVGGFDEQAKARLESYDWPGNIRQLENLIERAVLFDGNGLIGLDDLPNEVLDGEATHETSRVPAEGIGLKEAVKAETSRIERELIVRALEQTKGNVTQAARHLKISRKSMQIKMKELGLRDDSPR